MAENDTAERETRTGGEKPRPHRTARAIAWLCLGLFVGLILGARYGAPTRTARALLGTFLPPHPKNWSRDPIPEFKAGMTKGEVVDRLDVGRVVVCAGAELDTWKSHSSNGGPPGAHPSWEADSATTTVETWLLPYRRAGLTNFLYLCFDNSQRLRAWGRSEVMLGFRTDGRP